MKKLILLLLVFTGMVSTASAKVIYIQDSWNFKNENLKDFCVHMWGGSTATTYPGTYLISGGTVNVATATVDNETDDNKTYYKVDLGNNTGFKVNNNKQGYSEDKNTGDLNTADYDDGGFYKIVSDNGMKLQKVEVYTYNFTVTTPAVWSSVVKIYLWNKSNDASITETFPGTTMTRDGSDGTKWTYECFSTQSSLGLILTNYWGDGYRQSGNKNTLPGNYSYYIEDNESTIVPYEVVTTNASGYCTYVNSNPLTISSATAYYATDNNDGSATAHAITNPAASTPMLIKGTSSTTYQFAVANSGTDYSSTNAFVKGDGTAPNSAEYNYILKGDQFYRSDGNTNTVAPNKAYLHLSVAASARPLIFEDEDITGINAISTVNAENGAYYNLQGVKVANPAKGLYIHNGKKIIVK